MTRTDKSMAMSHYRARRRKRIERRLAGQSMPDLAADDAEGGKGVDTPSGAGGWRAVVDRVSIANTEKPASALSQQYTNTLTNSLTRRRAREADDERQ